MIGRGVDHGAIDESRHELDGARAAREQRPDNAAVRVNSDRGVRAAALRRGIEGHGDIDVPVLFGIGRHVAPARRRRASASKRLQGSMNARCTRLVRAVRPTVHFGLENVQRHGAVVQELRMKGTQIEARTQTLFGALAQALGTFVRPWRTPAPRRAMRSPGRPHSGGPPHRSATAPASSPAPDRATSQAHGCRYRSPCRRRSPIDRPALRTSIRCRGTVPAARPGTRHRIPSLRRSRDRRPDGGISVNRRAPPGSRSGNGSPGSPRAGTSGSSARWVAPRGPRH